MDRGWRYKGRVTSPTCERVMISLRTNEPRKMRRISSGPGFLLGLPVAAGLSAKTGFVHDNRQMFTSALQKTIYV